MFEGVTHRVGLGLGRAVPTREVKGAAAQDAGYPDINIITEKVAFEGVTRFEDRNRLPLGISFNSTSLSASLLIQAAYDPLVRTPAHALLILARNEPVQASSAWLAVSVFGPSSPSLSQ